MITFNGFYHLLAEEQQLRPWLGTIPQLLESWHERQHGLFHRWEKALLKLPEHLDSQVDFSQQVHSFHDAIDGDERKKIEALLRFFHPWRKGPYHVQGIHVDSEWRSDFKWDRLLPHISSLDNRRVLDIGCGNGYHMWRMLGAGARYVIGVDPSDLFLVQFEAIRRLCNSEPRLHLLPLGMEQLPASQAFDTVFCMGVLYHRKSPIEAMEQLFEQLRSGGELVLETLVVDGDVHQVLVPGERYAKMRNVWFIPSVDALCHWLERVGFCNVRCVDVNQTSIAEQRATDWMTNESLPEFLHPADNNLTVEGYPAPKRAIIIANRP